MKVSKIIELIGWPIKKNLRFFLFMYFLGASCILIDPSVDKSRTFLELLLDTWLLCLFLSTLPPKVSSFCKVILSAIFYIVAIVDVYCQGRIGTGITPTLMQLTL